MINITPQGMVIGRPVISGTSGSGLFVDSNGNLGQNNNKFYWDDANSRLILGIGNTLSKTNTLQVYRGGNGGVMAGHSSYAAVFQSASFGIVCQSDANDTTAVFRMLGNNGANEIWRCEGNGNVGAGGSGFTSRFNVGNNNEYQINSTGLVVKYNNVSTTGWGHPAIYGSGRLTAQTGAVASVAAYTVGASDGSFIISMNVLITAFTAGSINGVVTYTDEGGTARSLTLNFSSIGGTLSATIGAAGAFEGVPLHIRVKASTAITCTTTVTVFTGTYNVEGYITQIG